MPITPDEYSYPFDPTGTAPSNKVVGEVHVITQQNHRDYSFIIPTFAPFFAEGVSILFTDIEGNPVPLVEGTDYYFGHHFLAASRSISKQVYGSISFISKEFKGTMSLSYQTLGGKWTYDPAYLNQLMTNIISNPRSSSWDSIVELPGLFPVIDHEWNLVDMVGMAEVVAGLYGIEQALIDPDGTGSGGGSGSQLMSHILNYQNPHQTTKLQVGLGNVVNYGVATQEDAETGVADNLYMTPIGVKQAITLQAVTPMMTHINRTDNPHTTTKAQVGLGSVDNYATATQAEAQDGVVNDKFVTPLRVKEAITNLAIPPITAHTQRTDNPHTVTKEQIGLGSVDNYSTANQAEAEAGTATDKFMTPALVKAAVNALSSAGSVGAHLSDTNNPHQTTAAQVGAYTQAEINTLLLGKLDTNGTVANSAKLDNLTVAQLTTQILANKVAEAFNADTVGGKSYAEIVAYITGASVANAAHLENNTLTEVLQLAAAQTSANAAKLENLTLLEIYEAIPQVANVTHQVAYDGIPTLSGGTELYTELFSVDITNPGDVIAMVSGGGTTAVGTDSYAYLIKANVRDNTLDIVNLLGIDSSLQFGVINTAGTLTVWMKSLLERQQVAIVELCNQFAVFPDVTPRTYLGAEVPANVTVTMPVGWVASTELNVTKALSTHTARTDNPHTTTKTQVGLGSVDDYATASQAEAEAGAVANKFMTPQRTAQAITAQVGTRTTTLETNVSTMMTELTTLFAGFTV